MKARLLVFLLLSLVACSPEAPDGAFACQDSRQCPSGWSCEARGSEGLRCYMAPSMDASVSLADASTDEGDGGTPERTGLGQTYAPDEVGMYACGSWRSVRATDAPPVDAEPYGVELQETGPRPEYLCQFRTTLDDTEVHLQGRGIFGQSCLAVMPAGKNVPERAIASRDFDVLVGSGFCARWKPLEAFFVSTNLLPTGKDVRGNATYSCLASVRSPALLPGMSKYLGRFEPDTKRCVFELAGNVRRAPGMPDESIEVLVKSR